jgi:hypothetical protein
MFAILSTSVLAYKMNDTQRIIGEYKDEGIFTSSSANISIKNSNNIWVLYNKPMINTDIGRFYYDYNCTQSGEYTASILYYNNVNSDVTESGQFYCGNPDKIAFGSCPTSNFGITILWVLLGLLLLIAIVGIAYNYPILIGVSGACYFFLTLVTWTCGDIITYIFMIFGIIFILISLNIKK